MVDSLDVDAKFGVRWCRMACLRVRISIPSLFMDLRGDLTRQHGTHPVGKMSIYVIYFLRELAGSARPVGVGDIFEDFDAAVAAFTFGTGFFLEKYDNNQISK